MNTMEITQQYSIEQSNALFLMIRTLIMLLDI